MPDDLLTTVKAALDHIGPMPRRRGKYSDPCAKYGHKVLQFVYLPRFAMHWLRALVARVEQAEGCDGECSCAISSRHEWHQAYCETRLKCEQAEAEVRSWQDQEASRGHCCWLNEERANKAEAEVERLRVELDIEKKLHAKAADDDAALREQHQQEMDLRVTYAAENAALRGKTCRRCDKWDECGEGDGQGLCAFFGVHVREDFSCAAWQLTEVPHD